MVEGDRWEDINEHVKSGWESDRTSFERVYEVLEHTPDGQTAADIADRALVSTPTARRHLNSLVNAGIAESEQDGRATLYRRNEELVQLTRIQELHSTAEKSELQDGIARMEAELDEFRQAYGADTPEALASAISGEDSEDWSVVTTWHSIRRNLRVARAALAYEEAQERLHP